MTSLVCIPLEQVMTSLVYIPLIQVLTSLVYIPHTGNTGHY